MSGSLYSDLNHLQFGNYLQRQLHIMPQLLQPGGSQGMWNSGQVALHVGVAAIDVLAKTDKGSEMLPGPLGTELDPTIFTCLALTAHLLLHDWCAVMIGFLMRK